jgi:hypothetical protein
MALTEEKLLSAAELADALGQHVNIVRNKAKAHVIPSYWIGGEWRFKLSEVLAATRNDYPELTNNDKAAVAAKEEG